MIFEKQNKARIFGLDVVRATAIMLVLVSHFNYLLDNSSNFLLTFGGVFGYVGVELFFVLSGFLIGTILLKLFLQKSFQLPQVYTFIKRRWFRTLPAYYLVLLLQGILAIIFHFDFSNVWKYLFFIQNFSTYDIGLFKESWSLSVEEWVYLVLPFALFFVSSFFRLNKKWLFLSLILSLIVLAHFFRFFIYKNGNIPDINTWNTEIKSVVIYRFDAILYGFILAWLHYYYANVLKRLSVYLLILAAHLFFIQFFVLNVLQFDFFTSPLYFKVFYFTLTAITISMAMPVFIYWKSAPTLLVKPVTFVSKISYSIYLLHYSIIAMLLKYGIALSGLKFSDLYLILVYVLVTFLLSFLLYRFVEKPIMKLRDK